MDSTINRLTAKLCSWLSTRLRSRVNAGQEDVELPPVSPWDPAVFPVGTTVRIADMAVLERFLNNWKYHHKLQSEQLAYAGMVAEVTDTGMYHGGGVIYQLKEVPGFWHECCLLKAE